jgi:hypothetical protein
MTTELPRDSLAPDAATDDAFTRLEKEMAAMKNAIGGLSRACFQLRRMVAQAS